MSDAPDLTVTRSAPPPKVWRVTLGDGTARTIEAITFRVEGGALVLLLPAGCVAAFAPGQWLTVESVSPLQAVPPVNVPQSAQGNSHVRST